MSAATLGGLGGTKYALEGMEDGWNGVSRAGQEWKPEYRTRVGVSAMQHDGTAAAKENDGPGLL